VTRPHKSHPTWSDVKGKLAGLDRGALLALVHELYAASQDNRSFLDTRFGIGVDPLQPYKAVVARWLWPDVFKNQDYSASKAKKAIADYKKASGQPEGVAELSVFYCELAMGFAAEFGLDDDGFYGALIRMFEQALKIVMTLDETPRDAFVERLESVRTISRRIGWGVQDAFDDLWQGAGLEASE
jgi:hypothetical protein